MKVACGDPLAVFSHQLFFKTLPMKATEALVGLNLNTGLLCSLGIKICYMFLLPCFFKCIIFASIPCVYMGTPSPE